MESSLQTLSRNCWQPLVRRAAKAYVSGPVLTDALAICRRLVQHGVSGTLCFWNRAGDRPDATAEAYAAALSALATGHLSCQLSVKAPAIGLSHYLLAEVLERGRHGGISVIFDALGPETADSTLVLIENALPHYPALGCTLPGRWQRSLIDAEIAVHLKLGVRVVKGQWADPDDPLRDPCAGFLEIIDCLAGRARHVSVATHDPVLARESIRRLRAACTPCELELLYGLPVRKALRVAREERVPVRMYIPYGLGSLPYGFLHVHQNPRMLWWFIRDLLGGRPASCRRSVDAMEEPASSGVTRLDSAAVPHSQSRGH